MGSGVATPLMINIILEQSPKSKVGRLMGVGSLVITVAPAIGPTVGGAVSSILPWRAIFVIVIPVSYTHLDVYKRQDVAPTAAKLGKQIKYADKLGIPYVWFPADESAQDASDEVKNIITGDQQPADAQSWEPDTVYAQQTVTVEA